MCIIFPIEKLKKKTVWDDQYAANITEMATDGAESWSQD